MTRRAALRANAVARLRQVERGEPVALPAAGEFWVEHQVVIGPEVLCQYRSAAEASAFLAGWQQSDERGGTVPAADARRPVSETSAWLAGYRSRSSRIAFE